MKCFMCDKNLDPNKYVIENVRTYRCGDGKGTLHCLIYEIKDETLGWILGDVNLYLDRYQVIINMVEGSAVADEAFWLNGMCFYNTAPANIIPLEAIEPIDANIQDRISNYLLLG